MRIAVIGCGSMGRRHIRHALEFGHEVIAHDVAPNLIAHPEWSSGCTFRADCPQAEAYVIATPASTHAAWLQQLARVDALIFVEKPLALNVAELGLLPWQASASRIVVGYNLRFHPHVHALLAFIAQRGTPLHAALWVCCDSDTWPGQSYAETLLECSHEIDLAQYLLGAATCYGAASLQHGRAWDLHLKCGETATTIWMDTTSADYRRGVAIEWRDGSRATWLYHAPTGQSSLLSNNTQRDEIVWLDDLYRAELTAWLRDGAGCSFADGFAVLGVCDDARRLQAGNVRE